MKNKKYLMGMCMLAAAISLTGCTNNETIKEANDEKIDIVATSFHEYDWVREIIGEEKDKYNLTLLLDNGVDLHSFQPSTADIAKIKAADLFIYNGGVSDAWAKDLVDGDSKVNHINVMEELGLEHHEHDHEHEEEHEHEEHEHEEEGHEEHKHEEEGHEEHEHEEEGHEEHEHEEHDHGDDEHIWLSFDLAKEAIGAIEDEISELDSENKDAYEANTESYIAEIDSLDKEYDAMRAEATRDEIVIADRFPFHYMMENYDITANAAFSGCSTDSEASFETVAKLTEKVNDLDLDQIAIIDNGSKELAETIISNSENKDCEIVSLDSLQAVTKERVNAGETYLSIMKSNIAVLKGLLTK